MKKKFIQKLTKVAFIVWLFSVPFSFAFSPAILEKNKSYTSFGLYNIYLVDATAIFFVIIALINLYWHKKSFLTCRSNIMCYVPSFLFAIFAFLSLFWSGSPLVSGIWGLRMLVIIVALFITAYFIQKSNYYRDLFLKILIAAGVIEGLIGLGQFIFQRSLGLYLLGESHLGPNILGLARVDLLGNNLIRAYGTFPHPNVLGGFLLFTIVATVWNKSVKYKNILIIIQLISLGLTFSRSALLGLLIIIILYFTCSRDGACPVSTKNWKSKKFLAFGSLILLISFIFLVRSPLQKLLSGRDETTILRIEYAKAAIARFIDSPILGRGWGTNSIELPAFSTFPFYFWEWQPVHNIYLLALSDLGIVGLLIFLYFIYQITFCRDGVCPVSTSIWKYLFIAYLFIGLFDHYLLTLPQGIFIFFASALLSLAIPGQKKEKTPLGT